MKGRIFGPAKFTASLSDEGWSITGNGTGGSCVRGSGSIALTALDGSTLTMQQAGLSCNPGYDPKNLIDNAAYLIVGGTGRFSGATGAGSVVTGIMNGQVWIHFDGDIVLAAAKSDEDLMHEDRNSGGPSESTGLNNGQGERPVGGANLFEDAKSDKDGASEKLPELRHGTLTVVAQ